MNKTMITKVSNGRKQPQNWMMLMLHLKKIQTLHIMHSQKVKYVLYRNFTENSIKIKLFTSL